MPRWQLRIPERLKHGVNGRRARAEFIANSLMEIAKLEQEEVVKRFGTRVSGLSEEEADSRLQEFGGNRVAQEKKTTILKRIFEVFMDPLILLLMALAVVSFFTHDYGSAAIITFLVLVSVFLRLFQELQADSAAQKLKEMVTTTCTVFRDGKKREIPMYLLVPGDIILLSAGDLVPGDVRLLSSKDLFVNQAALTGESLPIEKHAPAVSESARSPFELQNTCFMGSNVESGTAVGVVVMTGKSTYFGSIAESVSGARVETEFDRGIKGYTWLMLMFIFVLAPLVFLINALTKGNMIEAALFALAVVVGLTPAMLPMIVNVNLAKGARVMAGKKVIVKRLNTIQNFGAMDVLCTDKTGTLTQGRIILEKHIDVLGTEENEKVLEYAYLNSYYQTGLKNILDEAVLSHAEVKTDLQITANYRKVDEITFDFVRRRMSVVVRGAEGMPLLICKGAVEEVLSICKFAEAENRLFKLDSKHRANAKRIVGRLNKEGFRVLAVAYGAVDPNKSVYGAEDEKDLILSGFIAFLDPPKDSATKAIEKLRKNGIEVKVLTGDNELVTQRVCKQVGIEAKKIILGSQVQKMSKEELSKAVNEVSVFAKLSPVHKRMIVDALKSNGRVVGFLGDGINDSPALKAADVGISVDTAVDIAKESSDIILLEKSLLVLEEGVLEGRKVFGNIDKYIRMTASSSFGNMFSVVGGSAFLPFLPMKPVQVLVNNMLYDMSQTAIPTDEVDPEWMEKPKKWSIDKIRNFIVLMGPVSSLFDYATYGVMLFVFGCWANSADPQYQALFHTGWFVESLLTQTLVIHVIRTNKIPFLQSRASLPLTAATLIICAIGIALPYTQFGSDLGFVPLPLLYWPILGAMLLMYLALTQFVKSWFIRKYGYN